jgi:hypothetical protein
MLISHPDKSFPNFRSAMKTPLGAPASCRQGAFPRAEAPFAGGTPALLAYRYLFIPFLCHFLFATVYSMQMTGLA